MKKIILMVFSVIVCFNLSLMSQTKTQQKVVKFIIHTDLGDMKGILYNETPKHRDNFVKLTKSGFFDGLLFHRVISGFMIQGGDPDSKNAKPGQQLGSGGPGYTVPAEFNKEFIHKKGALSAARQADQVNPTKASSGSQFYIVQGQKYDENTLKMMSARSKMNYTEEQRKTYSTIGGTPHLDGAYTVFGEVVDGFDVIDRIAATKTGPGDVPVQPMTMTIEILK